MAAGLGFKTFTTGEVLTAADTNGYLMQGVLVFASSAARAAAITSPQEGQYSYLKDTDSTEYYDGAAWIAAPIGDITGVTAGTGISGGGTSGTVTVTNSMATAIDAKGDLVVGTGADTFSRLAVGANDTVLTADSSTATGLKWAAVAASGGMTLLSTTSLSGATTTISSISGSYTNLQVQIYNAAASSAGIVTFGINGDTTHHSQAALSGAGTIYATSLGKGNLTNNGNQDAASSGGTGNWTINFYNYAAGNRFHYEGGGMFYAGAWTSTFLGGAFEGTAAMTSLTITTSAGTFSSGTVKIWGIK